MTSSRSSSSRTQIRVQDSWKTFYGWLHRKVGEALRSTELGEELLRNSWKSRCNNSLASPYISIRHLNLFVFVCAPARLFLFCLVFELLNVQPTTEWPLSVYQCCRSMMTYFFYIIINFNVSIVNKWVISELSLRSTTSLVFNIIFFCQHNRLNVWSLLNERPL